MPTGPDHFEITHARDGIWRILTSLFGCKHLGYAL